MLNSNITGAWSMLFGISEN